MTFESMVDNASANVEVAVKVSFGDEMRRASFNGGAYVALHELVAKMFELDQAAFVVKYQDEDGDKITMSSDGEMKEALQLVKEKKLLRLFVELKPQVPKVDEATPPPAFEMPAYPCGAQMGFGARGRGGAFGPGHHGHHGPHSHGPHHGPHGHGPHGPGPHGPHGHGPHGPHGPHHGPHRGHGFRGGFGGFGCGGRGGFGGFGMRGGFAHHGRFGTNSPVATHAPTAADATEIPNVSPAPVPQAGDPNANYHTPHMFAHGSFSPVEHPFPRDSNGPYAARCAFKEHKHAMKEHIKFMKMNAATPEDQMAIDEFKEQMKSECKERWHAMKEAKKEAKKDRKCEKKDRKCDKKDKKWEKKSGKYNHPYAKHVADITIPDNSELPVDTPVTKTWRIRNEGHVAWPADSQLIFLSRKGDNLNGPERVFVGTVEPQQEVDVSVTFITPSEPGRYKGYYRMANGDGDKFGQRVWVSFIIPNDPVAAIAQEAEKIALSTTVTTTSAPAADDISMD